MSKTWKALYVASRSEKKVSETLLGKNIEAYAPVVKTMRQWSDRKKMVEMPLLNGYVFVRTATLAENDQVLQTKGVVSFVKWEGKIALIRDEEIARLKQLVELGYHLEASPTNKVYKAGDKIKIAAGALKGLEGYIVKAGENKLLEIVLESIGHTIKVKLPKEVVTEG